MALWLYRRTGELLRFFKNRQLPKMFKTVQLSLHPTHLNRANRTRWQEVAGRITRRMESQPHGVLGYRSTCYGRRKCFVVHRCGRSQETGESSDAQFCTGSLGRGSNTGLRVSCTLGADNILQRERSSNAIRYHPESGICRFSAAKPVFRQRAGGKDCSHPAPAFPERCHRSRA